MHDDPPPMDLYETEGQYLRRLTEFGMPLEEAKAKVREESILWDIARLDCGDDIKRVLERLARGE